MIIISCVDELKMWGWQLNFSGRTNAVARSVWRHGAVNMPTADAHVKPTEIYSCNSSRMPAPIRIQNILGRKRKEKATNGDGAKESFAMAAENETHFLLLLMLVAYCLLCGLRGKMFC